MNVNVCVNQNNVSIPIFAIDSKYLEEIGFEYYADFVKGKDGAFSSQEVKDGIDNTHFIYSVLSNFVKKKYDLDLTDSFYDTVENIRSFEESTDRTLSSVLEIDIKKIMEYNAESKKKWKDKNIPKFKLDNLLDETKIKDIIKNGLEQISLEKAIQ